MELYYHVLRDAGEKKADDSFMQFKQFEASLSNEDVKEGMKFRLRIQVVDWIFPTLMRLATSWPSVWE